MFTLTANIFLNWKTLEISKRRKMRFSKNKTVDKRLLNVYSVSKKIPPEVFWHFFPNGWEFLDQVLVVLHTY